MFKFCRYLILFALLTGTGCDRITDPNNNIIDYESYFYFADSSGNRTTTFNYGEDIFFNFGVINKSSSEIEYYKSHGGPPVSFYLSRNDSLIGTSDDGKSYTMALVPGQIDGNDTLQYRTSWYSNQVHDTLSPGQYKCILIPHLITRDDEYDPIVDKDSRALNIRRE